MCCLLCPKIWRTDAGHLGGGLGGDTLHLLAHLPAGDTPAVQLLKVGHSSEDLQGGRKPAKRLAEMLDMMEFCPESLEQSLPFSLPRHKKWEALQ
jgi:hypothetical protein